MLAGDLIMRALRGRKRSTDSSLIKASLEGTPAIPTGSDQGGTDPGNIGEFLAYDIPFETPPAQEFVFPSEVHDD